jgi:hypothetical protein
MIYGLRIIITQSILSPTCKPSGLATTPTKQDGEHDQLAHRVGFIYLSLLMP